MSENSSDSVLGSLPHSRPHRRSEKRAVRAATTSTPDEPVEAAAAEAAAAQRAAPAHDPEPAAAGCRSLPAGTELLGTAVKAAVELTEIGITVGARALRVAISRLPRP